MPSPAVPANASWKKVHAHFHQSEEELIDESREKTQKTKVELKLMSSRHEREQLYKCTLVGYENLGSD